MRNLIGQRFGQLTVIEKAGINGHSILWLCHCDCGINKAIAANHLLSSNGTKSCGCLKISKQQKTEILCKNCKILQHKDNFYKKWKNHGDTRQNICKKCSRITLNETKKQCDKKLRLMTIIHYGGNPPKCACCGENKSEFLTIDHINGGGRHHRKANGGRINRWLRKMKYPPGFQVLCFNCNCAKGIYGKCPHQKNDHSQLYGSPI